MRIEPAYHWGRLACQIEVATLEVGFPARNWRMKPQLMRSHTGQIKWSSNKKEGMSSGSSWDIEKLGHFFFEHVETDF